MSSSNPPPHAVEASVCCDETEQQVSYCGQNENCKTMILKRGMNQKPNFPGDNKSSHNSGILRKRGLRLLRRNYPRCGGVQPLVAAPEFCGGCGGVQPLVAAPEFCGGCGGVQPLVAAPEFCGGCGGVQPLVAAPGFCGGFGGCGGPSIMNQEALSDQELCQANCVEHAYEEQCSCDGETMGSNENQSSFIMNL
ncbi:428_t:CDS:2 [Acaulospora colombiana]|uniref:428_t:CDS:1 n=1 Tax=Acaulospora colombiana TaxID=27376 RepID=A0ACA9LF51_9GLOM|nr:428_t:CDS:2 [Acaulospora colombiana]